MPPLIYNFNYYTVLLDATTEHFLDSFCCGDNLFDRYVKESALKESEEGKGVTYLVIDSTREVIVAYYTLSATSLLYVLDNGSDDENNNIQGIPSIEIKMFAVNINYQDTLCSSGKLGDQLISDIILGSIIGDIYNITRNIVGAQMIMLYSIPKAINFYKRNNFLPLDEYKAFYSNFTEGCVPMYLKLF